MNLLVGVGLLVGGLGLAVFMGAFGAELLARWLADRRLTVRI